MRIPLTEIQAEVLRNITKQQALLQREMQIALAMVVEKPGKAKLHLGNDPYIEVADNDDKIPG